MAVAQLKNLQRRLQLLNDEANKALTVLVVMSCGGHWS